MRKVELTEAGQLYYERCKRIVDEARIAHEDVAASRLRRILPGWQTRPTPVYALTETRLLPAKTQRFIEFLKERLGTKA